MSKELIQLQGITADFNVVNIGTFETALQAKQHEAMLCQKGKVSFRFFNLRKVIGNKANNGIANRESHFKS